MSKHILITGGSGLVGRYLTDALLRKGYTVSHLGRKVSPNPNVKTFLWNVEQGIIHPDSIAGVDTIVHLAGEGIADKKWTTERKREIVYSRTKSIQLIYSLLKANPEHTVKHVISASAIGYYGDRGNETLHENALPSQDFMGECCVRWENAVDEGKELGLRLVKFRTGIVLVKDTGALPQLAMPIKFGVGSPLGSGKQWMPWIHIQDVVDMYVLAIDTEELHGVYNMVAPNSVTNTEMTKAIAKQLHKPLWAPKVPAWVLKLILGEMAVMVLGSTKVSPAMIQLAGYKFLYENLGDALEAIYGPPKPLRKDMIAEKVPENF